MLETIQDLKTRRSCRGYKEEQISEEQLNQILEAGTYAPTGMGMQSPIMVVVQDKETIAQLSRMNAKIMGTDGDPFYGAPTVVIVLADKNRPTYLEDGSLVMGNLMNAAHAVGVDSCLKSGGSRAIMSESDIVCSDTQKMLRHRQSHGKKTIFIASNKESEILI